MPDYTVKLQALLSDTFQLVLLKLHLLLYLPDLYLMDFSI